MITAKRLAKKVEARIIQWGESQNIVTANKSPEQEKWQKFFKKYEGQVHSGTKAMMVEAISEITGVDLKFMQNRDVVSFIQGVIVIPTDNMNSHSYRIGQPILCYKGGTSLFLDDHGHMGNHMDTHVMSFRLPSQKEIESFLGKLRKYSPVRFQELDSFLRKIGD